MSEKERQEWQIGRLIRDQSDDDAVCRDNYAGAPYSHHAPRTPQWRNGNPCAEFARDHVRK